jgi:Tfp pilus assembly protein PilV
MKTPMTSSRRSFDERGFTIVEIMVAALILVVGTLGTIALIDGANATTTSTKAREQGVNVQREIVEAARSVPYSQLTPTSIVSRIQATTGLEDSNASSPGWTIRRRGITYSVSTGVCSVDDSKDGTATHDAASFCATGAGTTTAGQCRNFLGITGSIQGAGTAATGSAAIGDCGIDLNLDGAVDNLVEASVNLCLLGLCITPTGTDRNPDDYKRVVTLVRWDRGSGNRYALQSSTISNPGLSAGPQLATPTSNPVNTSQVGPGNDSITFSVMALQTPYTVSWLLDGTPQGTASGTALGPYTWSWNLGSVGSTTPNSGQVMDGTYVVGVKAYDRFGVYGNTKALTFSLNRRAPYAPTGFAGGRNGSVVDFEWAPNRERDLSGYRVYRTTNGSAVVCTLTTATSCQDTNPPGGLIVNYYVVAVDKEPTTGVLREGNQSSTIGVTSLNSPPNAPTNLTATTVGSNTALSWSAPAIQDPNLGDSIAFYRIYRDGSAFVDRYDRTASNEVTWTDSHTGGTTHSYRITAVDTQLAESNMVGPVTR